MDPKTFMCGPDGCPITSPEGTITLRDVDHVTVAYSEETADEFEPFVNELLGR